MDIWQAIAAISAGVLLITVLVAWKTSRRLAAVQADLQALRHAKQSQSTRYGQITEHFAPWMAHWPWDPKQFKFIGEPIDGIQFTGEAVILVEIKSSRSKLSAAQRHVRDLVKQGRVQWQEVRIE